MNKELMSKWLDALRSGDYHQTKGRLYDGDNGYCCLGVADAVCFNAEFTEDEASGSWRDELGYEDVLSPPRADALSLDQLTTAEELSRIREIPGMSHVDVHYTRMSVLYSLNDADLPFEAIAAFIEEMGWDA